jgi:hypothetical protein
MRIILIRIMAFVSDKTQGNLDAAENEPPTAPPGVARGRQHRSSRSGSNQLLSERQKNIVFVCANSIFLVNLA